LTCPRLPRLLGELMVNRSDRRPLSLDKSKTFEVVELIRPGRADFHHGQGRYTMPHRIDRIYVSNRLQTSTTQRSCRAGSIYDLPGALTRDKCYPRAAGCLTRGATHQQSRLVGGGRHDEATGYGDTQGNQAGDRGALSGGGQVGAPPDPGRVHPGDGLSPQARPARTQSAICTPATTTASADLDEAVRQALTLLWEAADRICGKRLKALLPVLIESIERRGHLRLGRW
jgi:hypothetical protein